MPRLKPHRVPYDARGGWRAMPLEAWQPGRTVVAGCVRVAGCGGAELSPQPGISCGWLLALLDVMGKILRDKKKDQ
jgi:hypothetical protein